LNRLIEGSPKGMGRSGGLSETERKDLLERIDAAVGGTPKGELLKQLVEALPSRDRKAPDVTLLMPSEARN